jgi:polysaccharide export outer membrane protein
MGMPFKTVLAALAALVLSACASSDSSAITATSLPMPDVAYVQPVGSMGEYRIGALDVVEVSVYQVPDLTRSVQVDATGNISLPLIGSVVAAGRTTAELREEIAKRLSVKYLQSPEVSVGVKEFTSQRVTVDGAVTQAGVYPIKGRTTLMQAVALARGATPIANERQVVVFRNVNGQRMAARFDLVAIREGKVDDPEIFGNDVIVVDRSGRRTFMREVIGALPLMSIFSPLF